MQTRGGGGGPKSRKFCRRHLSRGYAQTKSIFQRWDKIVPYVFMKCDASYKSDFNCYDYWVSDSPNAMLQYHLCCSHSPPSSQPATARASGVRRPYSPEPRAIFQENAKQLTIDAAFLPFADPPIVQYRRSTDTRAALK